MGPETPGFSVSYYVKGFPRLGGVGPLPCFHNRFIIASLQILAALRAFMELNS